MDRRVVDSLLALPERHRFMKGLYAWVGFSVALDYEPLPRRRRSHFGLSGALGLGTTGLLAFTAAPLRVLGLLGLALSLAALGYGVWVVVEYFWLGHPVPGYAAGGGHDVPERRAADVGGSAGRVRGAHLRRGQAAPLYLVAAEVGQGLPPLARP
jgi:hypothetical protein